MTDKIKSAWLSQIAQEVELAAGGSRIQQIMALGTLGIIGAGLPWATLAHNLTIPEADEIREALRKARAEISPPVVI